MFVFVLAVSMALVFSFLCSIFESVLLSLSHARIAALEQEGRKSGAILRRFKEHIDAPIAAILILNTIAHTIGASLAGASYENAFGSDSTLWIFSIVFTIAILLFTEIIPKTLGITFNRALATPVAYCVRGLVLALKPIVFVTQALSGLLKKSKADPITSIEEIRLLASLGHEEGSVGSRAAMIIEGAARLRELTVADVMVPRTRVTFVSAERGLEENMALMRNSGHSRFPFSSTRSLDDASGVILVKEFLFQRLDNESKEASEVNWDALKSEPILVPESGRLNNLLKTFQDRRRHMALVVNEYGGVDGIVTMEDILEEVVGDIVDESDRQIEDVTRQGDKWICRGHAEIRKVFEKLDLDVEAETVTLSGFLTERLEGIPKTGDVVQFKRFRFEVTKASERQAEVVEIRRV